MTHPTRSRSRRAFTLIELLVVISIIALLIGLLLPALGKARKNAQQIKSASQIRSMMQANISFSADNDEYFPLPSILDSDNATETETTGDNKNRTGNVFSVLVFERLIGPETLVDPAEADARARPFREYIYKFDSQASGAAAGNGIVQNTRGVVYDPRLKGSPLDVAAGTTPGGMADDPEFHNSFAHIVLGGARVNQWSMIEARPNRAIISNRGPVYQANSFAQTGEWALSDDDFGTGSTTLLIHGSTKSWAGNIGFGDGHVSFEQTPAPSNVRYTARGSVAGSVAPRTPDNLFVDEDDELATGSDPDAQFNAYLRIWKQGVPISSPALSSAMLSEEGNGAFAYVDGQSDEGPSFPTFPG